MLSDFKKFLLRGNVVDLAVAVVIGAALVAVVEALVKDLVTPIIAAFGGQPDFSDITFEINSSTFFIGDFINAVVTFIIIAAVIYFFVVVPVNALIARSRREPPPDPTTKACPECLSVIPLEARRCAFCTADLKAG